jgi:hypothetical protein
LRRSFNFLCFQFSLYHHLELIVALFFVSTQNFNTLTLFLESPSILTICFGHFSLASILLLFSFFTVALVNIFNWFYPFLVFFQSFLPHFQYLHLFKFILLFSFFYHCCIQFRLYTCSFIHFLNWRILINLLLLYRSRRIQLVSLFAGQILHIFLVMTHIFR